VTTRAATPIGGSSLDAVLTGAEPILALAPMQDVTDHAFWRLLARYGGADVYVTEYFRVYPGSRLDRNILRSITDNPTGPPVIAQLIGNDIPELVRTARELQRLPVAAVDLNLGCPAPVVYRKCAGGGLLRDLPRVDAILGALRDAVTGRFTVKTRIGFDSPARFDDLLDVLARRGPDWVTVHGRTVAEMYRSEVHYDLIARAVAALPCPVLANGNVFSAEKGRQVLVTTGARGLMIGRGAIRNPWIFEQFRQLRRGEPVRLPTGREVLAYIRDLYAAVARPDFTERSHVTRMKKFMNYVALGVEPTGHFLDQIRRAETERQFFDLCVAHLDHDRPLPLEPYPVPLGPRDVLAGAQQ
jgi:tRNA-dihydrouridine synthase